MRTVQRPWEVSTGRKPIESTRMDDSAHPGRTPQPQSTVAPGTVGPYRVDRRLGAGGMGEVYSGFDDRLDRPVALKRIRPDASDPERARRRFRREARSVARLHHSAIVQVLDWVESESGDWIVMELVEGQSLRQLLRAEGPLDPERAMRLARDVLAGLAAAHAQGIMHRDLKAENVMVAAELGGGRERAKILDFGLAASTDRGTVDPQATVLTTAEGALLGTFSSMAPEQILGRSVDHRADLFAAGILIYEMVTGVQPFRAPNPRETLAQICSAKQTPAHVRHGAVSPELSALIDRLLEKDPRKRPAHARDALETLETLPGALTPEASQGPGGAQPYLGQTTVETQFSSSFSSSIADGVPSVDHPTSNSSNSDASSSDASSSDASGSHRTKPTGRRWAIAIVLLLGAVGVLRSPWGPWPITATAREPLYVAVLPTRVPAEAEIAGEVSKDLDLVAGAIQTALLRGLVEFEGLAALEPGPAEEGVEDPKALAHAMAVDEILTSQLDCDARSCQIGLKRLDGATAQILWTRRFEVDLDYSLDLANAVREHLRSAFPERGQRPGMTDIVVRPEDYDEYTRLLQQFDSREGGLRIEPLLQRLGDIEKTSPHFVDLHLFEVRVLIKQYQVEQDSAALQRAEDAMARAESLSPEDPRVLARRAQVARIAGKLDEAAAALERLQALEPGNALALHQEALLLEARGQPDRALALMEEAVQRLPAARNYFDLADMAFRQGDVEATRRHLEAALERAPNHFAGRSRLATLELQSGSLERAAELFQGLIEQAPEFLELTNLGTVHLLLGHYDQAAGHYREALRLAPNNPAALLNLADAELLADQHGAAEILYAKVIERLEDLPDQSRSLTIRAQALARLGRDADAVADVQRALRAYPDHPGVAFEASLVYSLIDEPASALWNARRALAGGIEPRWFDFPWFDPLREQLSQELQDPTG